MIIIKCSEIKYLTTNNSTVELLILILANKLNNYNLNTGDHLILNDLFEFNIKLPS